MLYTLSNGLAMVSLLEVILANLWMKSFEKSLQEPNEERENKPPDRKRFASIITDSLLSEGKQLSSNHVKPDFMQKAKVSVTRSRRT